MSDRVFGTEPSPGREGSPPAETVPAPAGGAAIPGEGDAATRQSIAGADESASTPAAASAAGPELARVEIHRVFTGTGLFWGLVLATVLTVIVIILAIQNTQQITVKFLTFEGGAPLIAILLASLLVGVILDEIVGWAYRARRRRILTDKEELKRLRSTRERAEE